jgi:hypothetical protein
MSIAKFAATLAGSLGIGLVVTAMLMTAKDGNAAAQQTPPACVCAPAASAASIGTNLVHCQCGAATCVVSEHFTGQAKTYALQCIK